MLWNDIKNFDSAIALRVFSSLAQEQKFFDGDDPINQVCGCGNKETCQPLVKMNCNCNANSEERKKDQGRITAKSLLPISRFTYGPLIFANGQAKVQIGKLICSGKGNNFTYSTLSRGLQIVCAKNFIVWPKDFE